MQVSREGVGMGDASKDVQRVDDALLLRAMRRVGALAFLLDADDRRVLYASAAQASCWGLDGPRLRADGIDWAQAIHADDRAAALAAVARAVAGEEVSLALRVVGAEGDIQWLQARWLRVDDGDGRGVAVAVAARDLGEQQRLQQAMQDSRERLDGIVHAAMDAIVCVDAAQTIVLANPAAEAMFGYRADELRGQPLNLLIPPRYRQAHVQQVDHYGRSGQTTRHMGALRTVYGRRRDGEEFPLEVSISRHASAGGLFYTSIIRDISESQRAQRQIERLNRLYATLSAINQLVVRAQRREDLFEHACTIAVEQGGYALAWIGRVDRGIGKVVPEASASSAPGWLDSLGEDFPLHAEFTGDDDLVARAVRSAQPCIDRRSADASVAETPQHASRAALPLQLGSEVIGVFVLHSAERDCFDDEQMRLLRELAGDIAFAIDHIAKTDQLIYLSRYDALTGLANASLWADRLHQGLLAQPDPSRHTAVFALDIEHFRAINEALGRKAGDEVLRLVAQRFRIFDDVHSSRFCRTGEDRFGVFAHGMENAEQVARYLERRLDEVFREPLQVDGNPLRIAVKVGVALAPEDGGDAETLLRKAEAALKKAKADGRRYVFYAAEMTARVAERLALEARLRVAVDCGQFELYYQPKVAVADGRLVGCEALIRWHDPDAGLVLPGTFIAVLEETGLIHEVGRWVLRQAVADYLRWRDAGVVAPRIAVNVSPLQLRDPGFAAEVGSVLGGDRRAPEGIELEITESVIMDNAQAHIDALHSIRSLGASIAIDDFGTGFSSLGYLSRLPVDTLKIDRAFVVDMLGSANGLGLVSTIINIAHLMGLKVVAEGVESEEQRRLLRTLHCDQLQGYLFGRPMPAAQFERQFLDLAAEAGEPDVAA